MKNVTILLAVMMLAAPAYGAIVSEDFSSDPTTPSGNWKKEMGTGGSSDFGYDDTANAITGTWARDTTTSRYYTDQADGGGSFEITQDDSFTFSFDVTVTGSSSRYGPMLIGLMNPSGNNRTNVFYFWISNNGSSQWAMLVGYHDDGDDGKWEELEFILDYGLMSQDKLYHCQVDCDGGGKVEVNVTWDSGSETKNYSGWGETWTANAFGVSNWDKSGYSGTVDATVDNMNLVPEPATMVLLGIGGLGVLARRRRRA